VAGARPDGCHAVTIAPVTAPASARDTVAPAVGVRGLPTRASLAQLSRGLAVGVRTSEAARITVDLLGARGTRLARASARMGSGLRVLSVKASRTRLRGLRTATLRIVAVDGAGNRKTVTRTLRLR
jgi:hypothetical protein